MIHEEKTKEISGMTVVVLSDTTRPLMLYILHIYIYITDYVLHN